MKLFFYSQIIRNQKFKQHTCFHSVELFPNSFGGVSYPFSLSWKNLGLISDFIDQKYRKSLKGMKKKGMIKHETTLKVLVQWIQNNKIECNNKIKCDTVHEARNKKRLFHTWLMRTWTLCTHILEVDESLKREWSTCAVIDLAFCVRW